MKCPDTPKSVIAKLIRNDGEKDRVWNKSWNIFYEVYYDLINAMVVNSFAQFGCASVPPDDIVETVSDVFMSLIKAFESGTYKPGEYHFRGFLKLVAKRRTLDHLRKKSTVKSIPIESIEVIDALARENAQSRKYFDKLEENELKLYKRTLIMDIWESIRASYSPETALIFELRVFEEKSVAEICGQLGIERDKIDRAVHRITKKIRQELGKSKYEEDL